MFTLGHVYLITINFNAHKNPGRWIDMRDLIGKYKCRPGLNVSYKKNFLESKFSKCILYQEGSRMHNVYYL